MATAPRPTSMQRFAFCLGITFLITWGLWSVPVLAGHGRLTLSAPLQLVFLFAGSFGPFIAAFISSYRDGRGAAMWEFLSRAWRWRIAPLYLLPALFLSPLLGSVAAYLHAQHGGPAFAFDTTWFGFLTSLPILFFVGGSVNEEFGWAYSIDRLLERFKPLPAALLLGVIWGCWHLPLFYMVDTTQSYESFWVFLLFTVALRLQYVWAYLGTGRSLLATLLFHTSVNMAFTIFVIVVRTPDHEQFGYLAYCLLTAAASVLLVLATPLYRSALRPSA